MEWFSVHLQALRPADSDDLHPPLTETAASTLVTTATGKLMDLLEPYDGIVAAGPKSWEATISIRSIMPATAATVGGALIQAKAFEAGLPDWPPVRIEAIRQDVLYELLTAEEEDIHDA